MPFREKENDAEGISEIKKGRRTEKVANIEVNLMSTDYTKQ